MRAFFVTRFTIGNNASIHSHGVKQLTKIERSNLFTIFKTMLFIHAYIHTGLTLILL